MKKKILIILFLIMIIISACLIVGTYARYKNELTNTYENTLGKWKIRVNGTEISASTGVVNLELIDTDNPENTHLFYADSSFVQGGIAPGSEAYFELNIDPTVPQKDGEGNIIYDGGGNEILDSTEVSIKYTIEIENESESIYMALIDSQTGDNFFDTNVVTPTANRVNNTLINIDTTANTYTGVFPLSQIEQGKKNFVRVRFVCENSEDISELEQLNATIHIKFEQYLGETI